MRELIKNYDKNKYLLPIRILALSYTFTLATFYLFNGAIKSTSILLVSTIITAITPIIFKRSKKNIKRRGHLLNINLLVTFTATSIFSGGIFAPTIWGYSFIPVISSHYTSKKHAFFYSASILTIVSALFIAQDFFNLNFNEVHGPTTLFPYFFSILTSYIILNISSILKLHSEKQTQSKTKEKETVEKSHDTSEKNKDVKKLTQIAGSIAHEVNNPLTIIQGSSRIINRIIKSFDQDNNTRKILKHLKTIDRTIYRISSTTKSLSLLSKDEGDSIVILSIEDIVEYIKNQTYKKLSHHEINIQLNIAQSLLSEKLEVYQGQVHQAFTNMLNFHFEQLLRTEEKIISINIRRDIQSAGNIIFELSNNVKSDIKTSNDLFHPNFKSQTIGNGPNLSFDLAKRLIENNRGQFDYNPEENKVKITLPVYDCEIKMAS